MSIEKRCASEINRACSMLSDALINGDRQKYKAAQKEIQVLRDVIFRVKNAKYLINTHSNKKVAAHIWGGTDTACRMYSTGGLVRGYYEPVESLGSRKICKNCQNAQKSAKNKAQRIQIERLYVDPDEESVT